MKDRIPYAQRALRKPVLIKKPNELPNRRTIPMIAA
jgi:hypothetical protein